MTWSENKHWNDSQFGSEELHYFDPDTSPRTNGVAATVKIIMYLRP